MSKCRNCNVEISDETERCPLCGSVLEYTGEVENMYPDVRVHTRKMTMISKIYLFCALLVEVLLIYINVVTESQIAWSAITGLGILLRIYADPFCNSWKDRLPRQNHGTHADGDTDRDRNRFSGRLPRMVCQLCIAVGDHFSDVGIIICMIVNRRNWQSYMMWQIFMILCSIVPVILIFTGIVTAQLFALIAFAFSLFLFLGTLIIGDRRARVELKRRFHVR